MRVPDGFRVSLVAAEPDVSQPIGMAIDTLGRLWVAECHSYPKWGQRSEDKVLIFSDNDGDGLPETRTVFAEGLSNLSGIEVGLGGVWLMCLPDLLFIADEDSDGKPDGPSTVVLDGWDAHPELAHHAANHLMFGPDGWLYGCEGCSATSLVGVPGTTPDERLLVDAAIWRVHPQSKAFEIVASGTGNPWGIDFNANGELFASNNVLAHLWHLLPGGRYESWKSTGREQDNGELRKWESFELMTACTDHNHWQGVDDWNVDPEKTRAAGGGHSHAGLMIYQGDNFPAEYAGVACMCNVHGNSVVFDVLDQSKAEIVAHHGGKLLEANDRAFRAVDLKYGPDGSVFVCDWNFKGECHGSDDDAVQPTGRIYRLAYGSPQAVQVDLGKLDDEALIALHDHKNEWFVRRARLVLQHRAQLGKLDVRTLARLSERARDSSQLATLRLRSLWTWHAVRGAMGGDHEADLCTQLLTDPSPEIRAWAVRLKTEQHPVSPETLAEFVHLAREDDSPQVERELISALDKLEPGPRLELAVAVLGRVTDKQPRNWHRLAWYGLEPLVASRPLHVVELDGTLQSSFLTQSIAHRLAEKWVTQAHRSELTAAFDQLLGQLPAATEAWQTATLRGLCDGLRSNRRRPPEAWKQAQEKLSAGASTAQRDLMSSISVQFGDPAEQEKLIELARNPSRSTADRLRALAACLARPNEKVSALVWQMCYSTDPQLSRAGILALGTCNLNPEELWVGYAKLRPEQQQALIEVAAGTPHYAKRFLDQLESGRIPISDVRAEVARQLFSLNDSSVSERLGRLWGDSAAADTDTQAEIERLAHLATPDAMSRADKTHGRALFGRLCAQCHLLFGEGRSLGPDLTGMQRDDPQRLIVDITNPNARVARQFQVTLVETDDGRVVTGMLQDENERQIVIRTVNDTVPIETSKIVNRKLMTESLMPRGLLRQLSDSDIQDLFSFLMSRSKPDHSLQSEKPKGPPQ
jgi:putative membrane-bound dehydrogenase-like protein